MKRETPAPETNHLPCRICGDSKRRQYYEARETLFGLGDKFPYFKCNACGCLQIAEIPEEMSRFYPQKYHDFFSQDHPGAKQNPLVRFAKNRRDRYAALNRGILGRWLYSRHPVMPLRSLSHISLGFDAQILDVGCGRGGLLYSLRQMGFKNLLGVDAFIKEDISYKNGLRVRKCSLQKATGLWDLVMFHHSFEHIEDQLKTLQSAASLLSENGVCLIRIPLSSSHAFEEYGVDWIHLDAPRHFFLHTSDSFKLLAKKAGLQIFKTVYDSGEFQFLGSEQCRRGIPYVSEQSYCLNPEGSIFTRSEIDFFKQRAAELNAEQKGDQAAFFLTRA